MPSPDAPVCDCQQQDASYGNDGIVHVLYRDRIRRWQDEKHADQNAELGGRVDSVKNRTYSVQLTRNEARLIGHDHRPRQKGPSSVRLHKVMHE
jgi:hypothetical protein